MSERPPFPDVVEIVVEIPRGSRNKYEYDEEAHVFRLDRVLSSAVYYNFDYGFIEGTRAGDGDHTDALLIIDEPTFTGCHVWARPIGGLEMRDEKGFDFKVLCVALGDAHQQHIERLEQVRPHRLVEIEHFFETYKALEDKAVDVVGWRDHVRALEVLRTDREAVGARDRPNRPRDREPRDVRAARAPTCPAAGSSSPSRSPTTLRRRRSLVERVARGGRSGRWSRRSLGPSRRAPPDASIPRSDPRRTPGPGGTRRGSRGAQPARPFEVSIGGAGVFPPHGRPRALWLGLREGEADLAALAATVDAALVARRLASSNPSRSRPI